MILFSNEENPLYLERGQRRVHVVNRRDAKVRTARLLSDAHGAGSSRAGPNWRRPTFFTTL